MSLTKVSYSMITGAPVNILDFGADPTGVADSTAAITAAVAAGLRVYAPAGSYKITSTITLREASYIFGDGSGATFFNSTATGATFQLLNALGLAEIEAPKFFDFYLGTTGSGIRLNTQSDPFLDNPTSQAYMMRPIIERVIIVGSQNATGYAVSWNKCFDGSIRNCKFVAFAYGIVFYGCDLNEISNNRIQSSGINCIAAISVNTFGSQTLILHNDLLGSPSESFITSSDRDILIQDNYLEGAGPTTAAIYISGGFYAKIDGNRVEVQAAAAPNWLRVGGAPAVNLTQLWVTNNVNNGTGWGAASFNSGSGSLYFYNANFRQQIFHQNNQSESGFPFNTQSDDGVVFPKSISPWVFTPAVTSLGSGDYGASIYVKNNAFVVPPIASVGSLTSWKPYSGLAGTFDVYLIGYAGVVNQVLNTQYGNGPFSAPVPVSTSSITLTTTSARYLVFSAIAPTDLYLRFWNNDTTRNSNVFIEQIIVQYT
jgi:hypothetical protein